VDDVICVSGGDGLGHGKNGSTCVGVAAGGGWMAGGSSRSIRLNPYICWVLMW
jgi:hypothetical protein